MKMTQEQFTALVAMIDAKVSYQIARDKDAWADGRYADEVTEKCSELFVVEQEVDA